MKKRIRTVNGYRVLYEPDYHRAMTNDNWKGYVYEHIFVVEKYLKRCLQDNEVVHHLDGNRANNRIENLLTLDRGQHAKLHAWLDSGAPGIERFGMNGVNSGKAKAVEPKYCVVCEATLQEKQRSACSKRCISLVRRKVIRPSKDKLRQELETNSYVALGKKYGVSNNAVKKWAKKYGLLSQS